jgi:hypothetical protein
LGCVVSGQISESFPKLWRFVKSNLRRGEVENIKRNIQNETGKNNFMMKYSKFLKL